MQATTEKAATITEMAPLVGHCIIAFAHIDGSLHLLINLVHQLQQMQNLGPEHRPIRSYNQISQNLDTLEDCLRSVGQLAPFASDLRTIFANVRTLKITRDFLAHGWLDVNALEVDTLSFAKKSERRGKPTKLETWTTDRRLLQAMAADSNRVAGELSSTIADIMDRYGIAALSHVIGDGSAG